MVRNGQNNLDPGELLVISGGFYDGKKVVYVMRALCEIVPELV